MKTTLFLCGDVMTGRGVDQVLPCSCSPELYEGSSASAVDYVALAEQAHGPIARPVDFDYVWGDALAVLERVRPDARIVNLETSVTTNATAYPKLVNYRMHPGNVRVLTAARIDCCVLANNHVIDWGEEGLLESIDTLAGARIRLAGAGRNIAEARAPAVVETQAGGRILVFALGAPDSGIPASWAAGVSRPGVNLLPDLSEQTAQSVAETVKAARQGNDVVIASIHWGGNWGYDIPSAHRRFARALIDRAHVDVVHGHSSHHPKAIEVYRDRPILYGCGDFLNDYEGIRGYEEFRDDLVLMYFLELDSETGRPGRLYMIPQQIRGFRLNHPSDADRSWLRAVLDRECSRFGHRIILHEGSFVLE